MHVFHSFERSKYTFQYNLFYGELGLLSFGNEGRSILGATDLSLGYRMTPQWAVGASLIGWSEPGSCCGGASASGTGVQLRYTPKEKGLMQLSINQFFRLTH